MITRVANWSFQDLRGRGAATFSPCEKYRYELHREWDSSKPALVFVGLNPSTADQASDDPTIRRILGFARSWGCGSLLMLNAFALRSTDPKGLVTTFDPVGAENDATLRRAFQLAADHGERLVVGWGIHGIIGNRGPIVAGWALGHHGNPEAFGLTKNGQPQHPLYLPGDSETSPLATLMASSVGA